MSRTAATIDPATLRRLSQRDPRAWLRAALGNWLLIGLLMGIAAWQPEPWVWLICGALIGTRQHALGVLGHDGSHFLVARSRKLNDRLTNAFASWPLFVDVRGFRPPHLEHHRLLETPEDPTRQGRDTFPADWTFPMSAGRLAWIIVTDLTGLGSIQLVALVKVLWNKGGGSGLAPVLLLHGSIVVLVLATGTWPFYLLLWVLPAFTVLGACYRIRALSDHFGLVPDAQRYNRPYVDDYAGTRSFRPGWLLGPLITPHSVGYHLEHHLYPSVPAHRLPELVALLEQDPTYRRRARKTHGHLALFRELVGAPRTPGWSGEVPCDLVDAERMDLDGVAAPVSR